MGIYERDIIEKYREMLTEKGGVNVSTDGLAILTAARVLKQTMEKCALEVCGSIDIHREAINSFDFTLTLPQANAIIDMDNIGHMKGLGPEPESRQGWGELLTQAEAITGRIADANLSDDQIEAQENGDEERKLAYRKSRGWD